MAEIAEQDARMRENNKSGPGKLESHPMAGQVAATTLPIAG